MKEAQTQLKTDLISLSQNEKADDIEIAGPEVALRCLIYISWEEE
jgi:hypothetical protein